jgi:hypothetical protein
MNSKGSIFEQEIHRRPTPTGSLHRDHADPLLQQPVARRSSELVIDANALTCCKRGASAMRFDQPDAGLHVSFADIQRGAPLVLQFHCRLLSPNYQAPPGGSCRSTSLTRGVEAPIHSSCQRFPIPNSCTGSHRYASFRFADPGCISADVGAHQIGGWARVSAYPRRRLAPVRRPPCTPAEASRMRENS